MSGKRYSEEFKIEAVKQITERNHPIGQVSKCTFYLGEVFPRSKWLSF
jgi:hypothetical protein